MGVMDGSEASELDRLEDEEWEAILEIADTRMREMAMSAHDRKWRAFNLAQMEAEA